MLALLGDYKFNISKHQLDSIKSSIDFSIVSSKRIGNYNKYQAVSKASESISFSGTLILEKLKELDEIVELGNKQEPVTLALPDSPVFKVVILKFTKDRKNFLNTGEYLEQAFSIELERCYP